LDDRSDKNHHKLAMVLGLSGDIEAQINEERLALEIEPENNDARIGLASALNAQGNKADAIAELKIILDKHPDNVDARAVLNKIEGSSRAVKNK
jgi:tetratricopeptide (TPR) repeat protein